MSAGLGLEGARRELLCLPCMSCLPASAPQLTSESQWDSLIHLDYYYILW